MPVDPAVRNRPADLTRAAVARWRRTLPLLGPAFVAAVAYVDPGNVATNMVAGAGFGYGLLWVVVAASAAAVLVQALTAKLGTATGRDLAELCRERLPGPLVLLLWLLAEAVAMATDLAEVVGGALALNLLVGLPLPAGGALVAAASFAMLALRSGGHRAFERAVSALLAVVGLGFGYLLLRDPPSASGVLGGLVPVLPGTAALVPAAGILGATVMPHVVYVHSALTPHRYRDVLGPVRHGAPGAVRARVLRVQRLDVGLAMATAGAVNSAMLVLAAVVFVGRPDVAEDLVLVHDGLVVAGGTVAGLAFGAAMLASGLASASVGTYAGEVVMAGFLHRRIPLPLRRALTLAPSMVVLGAGVDPTAALVWSQVVLALGIPFALVPLVAFTADRSLMGPWVNRRATTAAAWAVTAVVVVLDASLLVA